MPATSPGNWRQPRTGTPASRCWTATPPSEPPSPHTTPRKPVRPGLAFTSTGAPFAGRSLAEIDMGYQYRSAVIVPDNGSDADPPGRDYAPLATPGCRAPHMWINTPT